MVSEILGADSITGPVMLQLDRTNHSISSARQNYREDVPVILQNAFQTHPTAEQWKALFNGIAKTDFPMLFDLARIE